MIVDSEPLHHRAYDRALVEMGRAPIPFPEYAEWFSSRGEGLAWAERTLGIDRAALQRRKQEIYGEILHAEARLRDGAAAAIARLALGHRLAVATNSPRAEATFVLDRFGLAGAFERVIGREDYVRPKPAADPFVAALAALDVAAAEAVVVEDSFKGLSSARAAGIPCIVVPNAYTERGDFAGAALRLRSLAELDSGAVASVSRRAAG